ncbi:MAG TPA: hypothetical protein VGF48_09920 [Thermoanaerobaculia bacterium]|jgi:hypothetical protein
MKIINIDSLLTFARSLEKEVLYTLSRQRTAFTLEVTPAGIHFTPQFSSQPRMMRRANLEAALAAFSERQSFTPGDYPETKAAGTYWLTVVQRYLDANKS